MKSKSKLWMVFLKGGDKLVDDLEDLALLSLHGWHWLLLLIVVINLLFFILDTVYLTAVDCA